MFLDQKVAFVNKLCCVAPKKDVDGKFLFYTLCSQGFEDEFRQNMTGLIGGVSVSALKNISVIVPPISIQKSIAHYLDEAYKDIDTSIEAAQRCIDDYKKLKMSVITKAVSKGIGRSYSAGSIDDPWWGTIPEGWNLRNLKSISTKSISYGVVKLFEPDENGVKILNSF